MNTDTIKRKSVIGAKWTILMSSLAIPGTYILHMLLGRVSPEVLGMYSSILIFMQSLVVFISFSSTSVMPNFIPKIKIQKDIPKFILSHSFIVFCLVIAFIILICFFPSFLEFLFKRKIQRELLLFFIIFAPIIVLHNIVQSTLTGFLEIKSASLLSRLQLFAVLTIVTIFIVISRQFFQENYFAILTSSALLVNLLGCIAGTRGITKRVRFKPIKSLYFPKGFWSFSLSMYIGSILYFSFLNIDRIFILKSGDLYQLGLYQAVISIWMLIDFFPLLLLRILVPMFSSFIAQDNKDKIQKIYFNVEKFCILVAISSGLFIISFSKELLEIFGSEYKANYMLLILLVAGSSFATLQYVNNPLLISTEKNKERLFNAFLRVGFQLAMTVVLLKPLGLLGIVLARVSALLLSQVIPIYVVIRKLPYSITIPKHFYWGAFATMVCCTCCYCLKTHSIISHSIVFFGCCLLFIFTARYSLNDFRYLIQLVSGRK